MVVLRSLLFLVIFESLQSCLGLLQHLQKPRSPLHWDTKLCSLESSTSEVSGESKRSRFNEKLLLDAKRLREEAAEFEKISKLPNNQTDDEIRGGTSNGTSIRATDEFIGRFPIEKVVNTTNVFTMGAFNSDISSLSATVFNGTYMSVLVERESDSTKKKLFLDKISGEILRNKKEIASTTSTTTRVPATAEEEFKGLMADLLSGKTEKPVDTIGSSQRLKRKQRRTLEHHSAVLWMTTVVSSKISYHYQPPLLQ
jgi:hypothetical protein